MVPTLEGASLAQNAGMLLASPALCAAVASACFLATILLVKHRLSMKTLRRLGRMQSAGQQLPMCVHQRGMSASLLARHIHACKRQVFGFLYKRARLGYAGPYKPAGTASAPTSARDSTAVVISPRLAGMGVITSCGVGKQTVIGLAVEGMQAHRTRQEHLMARMRRRVTPRSPLTDDITAGLTPLSAPRPAPPTSFKMALITAPVVRAVPLPHTNASGCDTSTVRDQSCTPPAMVRTEPCIQTSPFAEYAKTPIETEAPASPSAAPASARVCSPCNLRTAVEAAAQGAGSTRIWCDLQNAQHLDQPQQHSPATASSITASSISEASPSQGDEATSSLSGGPPRYGDDECLVTISLKGGPQAHRACAPQQQPGVASKAAIAAALQAGVRASTAVSKGASAEAVLCMRPRV